MEYIVYNADNVILTHIVKCRIDVGELQASLDLPVCKLCNEPAAVFCEDCGEYYCQTCDELAHEGDDAAGDERSKRLMQIRGQHNRVAPESQPRRFGFCDTHPKRYNEYYDRTRNQAYCTECAIEMA